MIGEGNNLHYYNATVLSVEVQIGVPLLGAQRHEPFLGEVEYENEGYLMHETTSACDAAPIAPLYSPSPCIINLVCQKQPWRIDHDAES